MKLVIAFALLCVAACASAQFSHSDQGSWQPAVCQTGQRQSPINVRTLDAQLLRPDGPMHPLLTRYFVERNNVEEEAGTGLRLSSPGVSSTGSATVSHNGYAIEVAANGVFASGDALYDSKYELQKMEFHFPSEHTLDGRQFAGELQYFHQSADGTLGMVALFLEEGPFNPWLEQLLNNVPGSPAAGSATVAINDLYAPIRLGKWIAYEGSLTTPPCTEGVQWHVYECPMYASAAQLARFPASARNNNRNIQSEFGNFPRRSTWGETNCQCNCDCADLELTKTFEGITGFEGDNNGVDECLVAGAGEGVWHIEIRNLGPRDPTGCGPAVAKRVIFEDVVPTPLQITSVSSPSTAGQPCAVIGGKVVCVFGDMEVGAVRTVRIAFRVAKDAPESVVKNLAKVKTFTRDCDLCNNEDEAYVRICRESDLSITKTAEPKVIAGDVDGNGNRVVHTASIRIFNAGPSNAARVVVTDLFPANGLLLQFPISADQGTCTNNGVGFDCEFGELACNESRLITYTYVTDADAKPGLRCNVAAVESASRELFAQNNVAVACTDVCTETNIRISKSDGVEVVVAGEADVRTYEIVVTNDGPSTARDVSVWDHWPERFLRNGPALTLDGGYCLNTHGGNDFTCLLENILVGQQKRVRVSYTVPKDTPACEVINRAATRTVTFEPNQEDNKDYDVNRVTHRSNLVVQKTDNRNTIDINNGDGPQQYIIRISNTGPSVARSVCLIDYWPRELVPFKKTLTTSVNGITSSQGRCNVQGFDFYCDFGDIGCGPDEFVEVRVNYVVADSCVQCPTIATNRASVFSPSQENPVNFTDETTLACNGGQEKRDVPSDETIQRALKVETSRTETELSIKITNNNDKAHTIDHAKWVVSPEGSKNVHHVHVAKEHALIKESSCAHIDGKTLNAGESVACAIKLHKTVSADSKFVVHAEDPAASTVARA